MPANIKQLAQRKTFRLNAAYLLTTLGDRMWMFAIGIFMHQLGGMTWVAVQQFFDALIKLSALPIVGPIMDKLNRNKIIQYSLALNNLCVCASAAAFCACFYTMQNSVEKDLGNSMILFITAILFASVSRLASEVQRICFTKDWIVVITNSFPEEGVTLSQQNSIMSVIDQSSSVVLPVLTGLLFQYFGWTVSCITIIGYNLCSWYVESNILLKLYNVATALHNRESIEKESQDDVPAESWMHSFKLYFKQSTWPAGFGLALLYMTVLGFDNLAGSYGQKHGMSLATLGLFRTFGSLLGVLGAISFGRIEPKIGLLWTAFLGLTWQNIFINLSGISTVLPGSPMNISGYVENFDTKKWANEMLYNVQNPENHDQSTMAFWDLPISIKLFFIGITFARFGLWMADPAITQIQQESIHESQRYSVFAMQTVFCEAFSLLKDTIVIMFPNTELFGGLAIASCMFVFCGYLFYSYYFAQESCSRKKPRKDENATEMIQRPETNTLLNNKNQA